MDLNNPTWVWSHTEVFGDKEELLLRSEAGSGNFCPERGGSFYLGGGTFARSGEGAFIWERELLPGAGRELSFGRGNFCPERGGSFHLGGGTFARSGEGAFIWERELLPGAGRELSFGRGNFCPERGGNFHLRGENFRPEAEEGESLFREQTKSP
ncbi:hypothetical protein [Bacteroides pyogenes]|uniref:hypothetical protein n=1 Tax=Bacteroides pyogenes TaxID=310300 RepID=UPI0011C0730D|nr:hypothetical protein [Bacteroides pyogenes]